MTPQPLSSLTDLLRGFRAFYPNVSDGLVNRLENTVRTARKRTSQLESLPNRWYQDAVVYALYVDKFNQTFEGLLEKIPYLQNIGVTCIWMLPVLQSPMRDDGFDVSDYQDLRSDLFVEQYKSASQRRTAFKTVIRTLTQAGIRVIFDLPLNHTSDEHVWFREARQGPTNPYRSFYKWSHTSEEQQSARVIFQGIEHSNWEPEGKMFYYHRFFKFQPDLNYANPEVFVAIAEAIMTWLEHGVAGFRADALPFLWDADQTPGESLPETHRLTALFRRVIEVVRPGSVWLAEAAQPPETMADYVATGLECNAAYDFLRAPAIFSALTQEAPDSLVKAVRTVGALPVAPDSCWFTFLRIHDELTLELLPPAERSALFESYCHQPEWSFRGGLGIAARLADLLQGDVDAIMLAYALLFGLPGTPVLYYGDERALRADAHYQSMRAAETGTPDARLAMRAPIDWGAVSNNASSPLITTISHLSALYHRLPALRVGDLHVLPHDDPRIFTCKLVHASGDVWCAYNFSKTASVALQPPSDSEMLIERHYAHHQSLAVLSPQGFVWFLTKSME